MSVWKLRTKATVHLKDVELVVLYSEQGLKP